MKRAALRFFCRTAIQIGSGFALFYIAVTLGSNEGDPWRDVLRDGLVVGVCTGLGLAAVSTAAALKAVAASGLRLEDIDLMWVRQSREVELPFGLLDALELVEETLRTRRGLTRVSSDAAHYKVTAWTGGHWDSSGGLITVSLAPVGELADATSRATVECRAKFHLFAVDFGRSKAHVREIALALGQAVNQRLHAGREATVTATLQAQLQRARLVLLQARVEPQFLHNTLTSLQSLIRSDAGAADEMVGDLIAYLRLSMPQFRGAKLTLARELELVRAYLNIMKARMRERLDVRIESESEAGDLAFPPLLLHALVESSIRHGIEPRPEGGAISIGVARTGGDGMLTIRVTDTGAGLQPGEGRVDGLSNLRERLQLLYKGDARFTLSHNSPRGVVCTLDIPCAEAGPP